MRHIGERPVRSRALRRGRDMGLKRSFGCRRSEFRKEEE
jgi:hypothetical protein